jgi:hypothetical protein
MAMRHRIHIVPIIVLVPIQRLSTFNEISFECCDLLMLEPATYIFSLRSLIFALKRLFHFLVATLVRLRL